MKRLAPPAEHVVPGPRPVASRSVVDLVIEEVRRSILDGSLSPGAAVSISELSDRLAVSHIPVREALRRLEGEGLIALRHSRSATVAPLSVHDLEEIFHLRALVEGETMARAVHLYTEDDLAAVEDAWAALHLRPDDDAEAVFVRHRELHRLLVRPAAGEWDRRILDILWLAGERYVRLLIVTKTLAGPPARLYEAHRGLVEAARSRSARLARRATREHTELATGVIATLLADGESREPSGVAKGGPLAPPDPGAP